MSELSCIGPSQTKAIWLASGEKAAKLSVPAPVPVASKSATVNFDTRNQVVAMGKKGFGAAEIAKTCGLQEGDVEVLLGMSRLQK